MRCGWYDHFDKEMREINQSDVERAVGIDETTGTSIYSTGDDL